MLFYDFLGNESLKERLSGMFRQEKSSHCYLLSGPEGSGKHTLATLLSAALQCTAGGEKPCRSCPQCRKVFGSNHPDIIFVDDEDKKMIPVEQVRNACADVYIRPNEGKKKIYIFPHAEKLNPIGQNTLLKILEEPPAYAVFLLLSPNPGLLLPTVRSRCSELHLAPLPEATLLAALRQRCPGKQEEEYRLAASARYLGQAMAKLKHAARSDRAMEFAAAFAERDTLAMTMLLAPMEKWTRDKLLPMLQEWELLLMEALSARCGAAEAAPEVLRICSLRTAKEILAAIEELRLAQIRCNANVGVGAICGALAVKL